MCSLTLAGFVVCLGLALSSASHAEDADIGAAVAADRKDAARADAERADADQPKLPERALLRLGTDDLRVKESLTDVRFSPQGRFLVANSANEATPTVVLFDVSTGRRLRSLTLPAENKGWVTCLAISSDESRLLWGETNGSVALWDLTNDRLVFRTKAHKGYVYDVAFSPEGTLFASAGRDGKVQLRKSSDPEAAPQSFVVTEGRDPEQLGDSELCLTFTQDSNQLVAGSGESGSIFIWRIADGKLVRQIDKAHGPRPDSFNSCLNQLLPMAAGDVLVSVGQRTVPRERSRIKNAAKNVTLTEIRFWSLTSGELQRELPLGESHGFGYAALSPDETLMAIGEFGRLVLCDAVTGQIQRTVELPGVWGRRPAFSPDGKLVATPINNAIALFDVKTGERILHRDDLPAGSARSVAWSAAGDRIVTGHGDGIVRIWDAASGRMLAHRLLAPVVSPSGWDANPEFIAFTSDGKHIIAAGRRDDPVEYREGIAVRYDAATGKPLWQFFMKGSVSAAAMSPDEKILVASSTNGSLGDTRLYGIDLETGKPLFVLPAEEERRGSWSAEAIGFAPDSKAFWMATGDSELIRFARTGTETGRVSIDFRDAEAIKKKPDRRPQVWKAAFSPDAKTLATSTAESIRVWDVETGKLRRAIRHPHDHGCWMRFAPDGRTLATSDVMYAGDWGFDLVRIYDVDSGELVETIDPGDNRTSRMAFSPDGTKLVTAFVRGSTMLWDRKR